MNADFSECTLWNQPEEKRRPTIKSYWHSLPSSGQDCPRDNQRIERGEDILFLAVVLKHFKAVRWLKRFAVQGTRQQRYFLETEDGVLLSPVTLEETRPDDGWMLKQTMFARSLRQGARAFLLLSPELAGQCPRDGNRRWPHADQRGPTSGCLF